MPLTGVAEQYQLAVCFDQCHHPATTSSSLYPNPTVPINECHRRCEAVYNSCNSGQRAQAIEMCSDACTVSSEGEREAKRCVPDFPIFPECRLSQLQHNARLDQAAAVLDVCLADKAGGNDAAARLCRNAYRLAQGASDDLLDQCRNECPVA